MKHSHADSAHSCLSNETLGEDFVAAPPGTKLAHGEGRSFILAQRFFFVFPRGFALTSDRSPLLRPSFLQVDCGGYRLVRSAEMVDSKPLLQDRPPAYNTVPGAYEYGPQQPPPPHGYGSIPPPAPPPYAYPDGQGK